MAYARTNDWANGACPYVSVDANVSFQNNTTATVSYTVKYNTTSAGGAAYTNGTARNWSISIDGQSRSGSYNINGVTGSITLSSGSVTVNKTTSARNITVSVSWNPNLNWHGTYASSASGSTSLSIPAGVFTSVPAAPSNVTVTRSADNKIVISWKNNPTTGGISNNYLQVSKNDGSFTNVSTSIGGSTTSYTYTGGVSNSKYIFRVASHNSAGTSAYTNSTTVYTTPATPSGNYALQYTTSVISVNTNPSVSPYATSWEWQRSSNNSSWSTISNQNDNGFTDSGSIDLPYYRVRCKTPTNVYSSWSGGFRAVQQYRMFINASSTPKKIMINASSVPDKIYFKV